MDKSKVAVIKTTPETVIDDIERMMKSVDFESVLPKDKTVILKPNISWHFPFLSANTTPWQLEGVVRTLRNAGYEKIISVENRTVVTNAYKGEKLNKFVGVLKKYDVPTKYNFLPKDVTWVKYEPKGEMLVLDKIFPDGILIPDLFFDTSVLHLPTVKCHIYTTMTGSMKNAFGGLLNTKRHYTHSVIHQTLVDLLTIQKEIHTGIFTVMDGTLCGNGAGPRTMVPVEKDYMLAAEDSAAIDAVSSTLMGFDPADICCIRIADEKGLGNGKMENIEIVGEDISGVNFGFEQKDNAVSRFGKLFWFGPLKFMQHFLFHTPLVYFFIFGSYFYHDKIWWPTKGKRLMREVRKTTKWGKVFDEYD